MKKLSEYNAIPSTPPSHGSKDKGVSNLENELQQERSYLDALSQENKELEKIIANMDKELGYIKSNFPQNIEEGVIRADNEYWLRYQSQKESNRKLEREKKHLEMEIKQIEEQGVVNLDSLSQSELIMYVKQLERNKTDLTSELRANEWSLDKQAKESHHLDQIRTALDAEIRHYDEELAMFRHYNKTACPSATSRSSLQVSALRNDVAFSSLDESSSRRRKTLSPTPGFQRRTSKGALPADRRILDPSKGPVNKRHGIGNLPSLKQNPTPSIVVTDPNGGKAADTETRNGLKSPNLQISSVPFELQTPRNFENSPPPRPPSAVFSFDDDLVQEPIAEMKQDGSVTLRLGCGRSLTINVRVEEVVDCPNCKMTNKDKNRNDTTSDEEKTSS